jgi:hypothetical protein
VSIGDHAATARRVDVAGMIIGHLELGHDVQISAKPTWAPGTGPGPATKPRLPARGAQ